MKQALLYSVMATILLGGSAGVAASDTAKITLNAVVRPGTCTIKSTPATVAVADIKYSALSETETTTKAFAVRPKIEIDCARVHRGVYFSVTPGIIAGDGTNTSLFSLGGPVGLEVGDVRAAMEMGTYTLTPGIPTVDGVTPTTKGLRVLNDATKVTEAATSELLQSGKQYTFTQVTTNPSTQTTPSKISFDMDGEMVFPSLATIRAAGDNMLITKFNFETAVTLTAIF